MIIEADSQVLLSIQATIDALFLPRRQAAWNYERGTPAVYYERREAWRHGQGVRWASGAITAGARKSRQTTLERLQQAGLVGAIGRTRGRTQGVMLTDRGEAWCRSLLDFPWLDGTLHAMWETLAAEDHPDTWGCAFVPETAACGYGIDRWGDRAIVDHLIDLENALLPALIRGWVNETGDVEGHVRYTVNGGGHEALLTLDVPTYPDLPGPSKAAADFYWCEFGTAEIELHSATPNNTHEMGDLPLPCSEPDSATWFSGWLVASAKARPYRKDIQDRAEVRLRAKGYLP